MVNVEEWRERFQAIAGMSHRRADDSRLYQMRLVGGVGGRQGRSFRRSEQFVERPGKADPSSGQSPLRDDKRIGVALTLAKSQL